MDTPSLGICRCLEHNRQCARHRYTEPYVPRWFPFHHALCSGHTTTAQIFLDRGAPMQMAYKSDDHEKFSHDPTILHCAAARGMEDIMRRALEIDPSLMTKKAGDNPLTYASECWDAEGVIRLLLEAGADLEETDQRIHDGFQTPFYRYIELAYWGTSRRRCTC